MKRNTYYLVGNAHLDPMWRWRWQEGSMEAKATIRSALDRMKEFPDFRFVCSSASVFQWLEEFAPDMLQEVKQRVKEGRFILVGGWHVQPDCNLPSGEAFARQSLYNQRYFKETFGVTANVGYCVDSFGHCATLPMILRSSGMDSYIFMRPSPTEKDLDSDIFNWIAPDGSSVTACRLPGEYGPSFDSVEALKEYIAKIEEAYTADTNTLPLFYGVGNHGGGPTIRNLEVLSQYQKDNPGKTLIYSNLRDFFDDAKTHKLPDYQGELQHHASGCYASEPRVKNAIRRAECDLIAAENYGVLSQSLCGKPAKSETFRKAWNAVCFSHFHDSMGGCSIKKAHDDTLDMLGMAKYSAAVEENNALQTVAWQIDTHDSTFGQSLIVFNPHGFEVTQSVQVNAEFNAVCDAGGNAVTCQNIYSPSQDGTNRPDTLFRATVPALGYRVYYLRNAPSPLHCESTVFALPQDRPATAQCACGPVLENEHYRIRFENYSGYILSFLDKRTQQELICGRAAVPVVIDEYYHDTWSHGKNFFCDRMARFSDATVAVLESGPVRATVRVVSRYNDSVLTQDFSLEAGCDRLFVRAKIDWREKHKLLKLAWPMNVDDPQAYYEIPFGMICRPCDGEEEPGINWTAVKGANGGFAMLNNNTYSSSVEGSTLCQTVVRSPIFCDSGRDRLPEREYTAQGITEFCYELMQVGDGWSDIVRAGKVLNKGLTNILDTWHTGHLENDRFSGLSIDAENVMLSSVKRSEDNTGIILRVYETDGKEADFTASGCVLPCTLRGHITPFSAQTWYCKDGSEIWQPVLLTEEAKD